MEYDTNTLSNRASKLQNLVCDIVWSIDLMRDTLYNSASQLQNLVCDTVWSIDLMCDT